MKNLFIKSLYFLLAYNIFSYTMEQPPILSSSLEMTRQTKESIRESVNEIYTAISAVQTNKELDQSQRTAALKQFQAHANQLRKKAAPISVSLENLCGGLIEYIKETLGPESK